MSARAEALATRFEQANQNVIDLVSTCPEGGLAVTCPAEGWTAAALGAHIGYSYRGIIDNLIKPIVAGQEIPPFDLSIFDEPNAKQSAENAALPQEQVVTLLKNYGATAAGYLRSLDDDDLDSAMLPIMGDNPVTAQQLVEIVLIGHTEEHGQSLREGLS